MAGIVNRSQAKRLYNRSRDNKFENHEIREIDERKGGEGRFE